MARFITRIELHNSASEEDYRVLHAFMEAELFERTITSREGIKYHLPRAEYYRIAELTVQDVLTAAKRAAAKTNKNFAVIVSETSGSTWDGLPKVT